jgi:alkylhydroperoxidase family enzyme
MLDFAVKVTRHPTQIRRQDHERLREAGFDDRAILQITLIASWFNYINRVADALGVGKD